MANVAVLGSGGWGTALAVLLNQNKHKVTIWSWQQEEAARLIADRENKDFLPGIPISQSIFITNDKLKAVSNSEIVIIAVPSKYIRSTISEFKSFIDDSKIIVNVSKGIEEGTGLMISQVIRQVLPNCNMAILSGPSHAEEVGKNIPTACTIASDDLNVAYNIQDIFMCNSFRVYTSTDVIGIELGGALKNVIALAAGISDGLGFGDNTKAAIMTRGIAEISRLGVAMGASAETFAGLSGIGDLIVTCTSKHSRNRRAGILLGQGKSLEETLNTVRMVVEGINTARAAYELSLKYNVNMPIIYEINKVLFENKDPMLAVTELMLRGKRDEMD